MEIRDLKCCHFPAMHFPNIVERKRKESEKKSVYQSDRCCYLDPRDKRRGSSIKAWTLGKQN